MRHGATFSYVCLCLAAAVTVPEPLLLINKNETITKDPKTDMHFSTAFNALVVLLAASAVAAPVPAADVDTALVGPLY